MYLLRLFVAFVIGAVLLFACSDFSLDSTVDLDNGLPVDTLLTPKDSAAVERALEYLGLHGAQYGLTDPRSQLRVGFVAWSEEGVAEIGFGRVHEGVRVWYQGIRMLVPLNEQPVVTWSTLDPGFSLDVSARPIISEEAARLMYMDVHGGGWDYISGPDLWIRSFEGSYRLCWWVFASEGIDIENGDFSGTTLDTWFDAHSGELLYNLVNAYGP